MKLSLRSRVLLLVFVFNALVFGASSIVVIRAQRTENRRLQGIQEEITGRLAGALRGTIEADGLNMAPILDWPYWTAFEDAILVHENLSENDAGEIEPTGVELNPLGVFQRRASFDRQSVLGAIRDAIETQEPIEGVLEGRAIPIRGWGGLWVRTGRALDSRSFLTRMLAFFVLSTLLLTLGTFVAMRRLVLDPIRSLADGARRVAAGDLDVRLARPKRTDELSQLVGAFNDMTSQVRGFNERLEDEVRDATEKARQAEAAAMTQRRLAAMGEFAAGVAHEINNPLGGLQNAVHRLEAGELAPQKRRQYFELLSRGLTRIGETVHRLRRFTPRETEHEPVDLHAVVIDALELVRHRADRLGVALDYAAPPQVSDGASLEAVRVRGAANEIGQALLNLLANALDSLEEGGSRDPVGPRIDVVLARKGQHVLLSVRDNGPGVDAEARQRVSDLFYTTKEVGKGTGLGLALVHRTLAAHGGSVRLSSEPRRFFQVELEFPAEGERT